MSELNELKTKIDAAQKKLEPEALPPSTSMSSMNKGMRILTELMGIMLVCCLIGHGLDVWLSTSPGFLLGFICLGIVTFFYSLMKYIRRP